MTDIKKLALRVAKESPWYYDNEPVGDSDAIDFATRFLAAYLAEQEPVSLYPCGFKELNSLVIKNGAYLARGMNEDEPVTESIRSSAMVLVGYAKDMSDLLAKQPLFTAPPEPAPQQDITLPRWMPKQEPVCAAPLPEEVIALKQLWLADLEQATAELHPTPQSSSDEVREMVEGLRQCSKAFEKPWQSYESKAADLIERLAARVPDGCVVVPRKATVGIRTALRASGRRDWPSDELCNVRWAAAIAAGEVNP